MLTVVMVFSLMGLSVLAAPIAGAQTATAPTAASFMPVESPTAAMDKDQLSDTFDGVDSTSHLTAVGNANATTARWYICTDAGNATPTASDCETIGDDTSATTRTPTADGATTTNTAFEYNWDIPATYDEANFDIVAVLCNGSQPAVGALNNGGSCTVIRNNSIFLDDSSTEGGTAPTLGEVGTALPAGEIMGFCIQSTGPTCYATSSAFTADGHGGTTPTTYTLVFRTSPGVDFAAICVDPGANNTSTPNACAQTAAATSVNVTSTYEEWNATPSAIAAGDYDLGILGRDDTGGTAPDADAECQFTDTTLGGGGYCTLDDHYKVAVSGSQAATGSTLTATFASSGAAASASNCTADDDDEDNRNGSTELVRACVVDQFGNVLEGARITFQSTGVGNFASCTGAVAGTATPTGDATTCTTTTNSQGIATAVATNLAETGDTEGTPGTQNITVCVDNDATQATQGCSDETLTDTLTKNWFGVPNHVHLVVEGTGDADPCHDGDVFATVQQGDEETLLACVFNVDEVATPTLISGETATSWRLTWENSDPDNVAFAQNPPSETDANGQATLDVLAVDAGSSSITVNLLQGNTEVDDSQVTLTVPAGGGGTECNDGEDNDGDGDIDYPADDGCVSIDDDTENSDGGGTAVRQCNDGVDNDGDGQTDFPDDPGCSSATDNTESSDNTGTTPGACRNRGDDESVIVGTDGADVLVGTPGRDVICGAGGDDVISGKGGADLIQGNGGDDTIGSGGGKDNASGNGGNDSVSGNKGNDAVKGQGGNDTLKGNAGIDSLTGGKGADSLQGGDGPDILKGGAGNDTLRGGAGDDLLNGGDGNDNCFGNAGQDKVKGCE